MDTLKEQIEEMILRQRYDSDRCPTIEVAAQRIIDLVKEALIPEQLTAEEIELIEIGLALWVRTGSMERRKEHLKRVEPIQAKLQLIAGRKK